MIDFARFDQNGKYTMTGLASANGISHEDRSCLYIGKVDPSKYYHDLSTGRPVPIPPKPSPLHNYFDFESKEWHIDDDSLKYEANARRYRYLTESDWVTSRAYEKGEPVPQAWVDYRQALRDIPNQPGFPRNIVWPVAPSN